MYKEISLAFRKFLVNSYAYYKLDKSIISDSEYDEICKLLQNNLTLCNEAAQRLHPALYEKYKDEFKDFSSGSGYYIAEEDYPQIVKDVAHSKIRSKINGTNNRRDIKKSLSNK